MILEEASERKTLLISFADSSVSRRRPLSLRPCHATTRFRMPIKLTSLRQERNDCPGRGQIEFERHVIRCKVTRNWHISDFPAAITAA